MPNYSFIFRVNTAGIVDGAVSPAKTWYDVLPPHIYRNREFSYFEITGADSAGPIVQTDGRYVYTQYNTTYANIVRIDLLRETQEVFKISDVTPTVRNIGFGIDSIYVLTSRPAEFIIELSRSCKIKNIYSVPDTIVSIRAAEISKKYAYGVSAYDTYTLFRVKLDDGTYEEIYSTFYDLADFGLAIDGFFLWALTRTSPVELYRINLKDFTWSKITFPEEVTYAYFVCVTEEYIFAGVKATVPRIYRIGRYDMLYSYIDLPSDFELPHAAAYDGKYLWVTVGYAPGAIFRILPSDFSYMYYSLTDVGGGEPLGICFDGRSIISFYIRAGEPPAVLILPYTAGL